MKKATLLLINILFVLSSMAQTIYYVKTDGNDTNDGKSWTNGFATLTKAISTATKGDEIRIKEGTYNSIASYVIDKTLVIKGSFGVDGNQDYSKKTILDGNNSFKIMQIKSPITSGPAVVTLDGLVFKNASFAGNSYGGAVEYVKATGTVSNCTFTNNAASSTGGGALAFVNSTTKNTVANCLFDGNSGKSGGAIYCGTQTIVDIVNCTIANNTCDAGVGGGICSNGILNLKNSILWGNKKGTDTDQIKGNGKFNLEHNVIQDGVWLDYIQPNLQSNMVLQQNSNFTISGKSTPNGQIRVQCSWEAETVVHTTSVSANGLWSITVQTPTGSFDSRTISVEGKQKNVFTNILVGEVWLCSGQSNMLFRVKDVDNAATELQSADNYPNIRLLNMNQVQSDSTTDLFSAKWAVCSQSTIPNFSAVGYFFGRKLFQDLNVPIGLINASWGDTTAEVWVDRNLVLNSTDETMKTAALVNDNTPRSGATTPYKIGSAYNAMIYPVRNIPIAGAIWYQGESNEGTPYYYPSLLKTLVQGYRQIWNRTDAEFPFYLAQICPFNRLHNFPTYYANPTMRYIQAQTSELIANSGIECNDDVANLTNIHPTNKQDVGLRLAWLALNKTYGKTEYENKMTSLFKEFSIDGNQVTITFKNVGTGLKTKDELAPTMFEIAGSDKVFYPATATISGTDKVILSSSSVANPVAARLGWSYIKTTNLVNSENLPVSVFKTYSWLDATDEQ